MKYGVPKKAVMTPTGISEGAANVLPKVSLIIINIAPQKQKKGNKFLCFGPLKIRTQ